MTETKMKITAEDIQGTEPQPGDWYLDGDEDPLVVLEVSVGDGECQVFLWCVTDGDGHSYKATRSVDELSDYTKVRTMTLEPTL